MAITMKKAANMRLISRTVVSALRTQGPHYAGAIESLLFPSGSSGLDVADFMRRLAEHLENSTEEVSAAVSAVLNENEESIQATAQVGEAVDEMRENLLETEYLIAGTYGRKVPAEYGFKGETPQNPDLLMGAVEQIERALENKPFPTRTRRGRAALDPHALAGALATDRQRLKTCLEHNNAEDRESQQALAARDEAMDAWQFAYRGVANIATGLFFLARANRLADRVRETGNRRRGRPEPDDMTQAEQDSAGEISAEPTPATP